MAGRRIHLRAGGVSVVLLERSNALPAVLHWGAALDDDLTGLPALLMPVRNYGALDMPTLLALLPEPADGFAGRPGLQVMRAGRRTSWSPYFRTVDVEVDAGHATVEIVARDADTQVGLRSRIALEPSGLVRLRHSVTNDGDDVLWVLGLHALLPVPARAAELLDLSGRGWRERNPQRRPFHDGTLSRESRRGRTGHDASLVLAAGTPGFGFESGEVWGIHVAWSGDFVAYAERLPEGHQLLGGGELLGPGEVELAPGDSYDSPELLASWSDQGLNALSSRWHAWMRSLPTHPRSERPVVLNTWEAVWFDHDLDRLRSLADSAAELGVERFVLDDGWFRGRRDDTGGLGDWTVDPDVWPSGLHPLVDHVHELGMEFGLWVEPEMVNPESELARAQPDWLLRGRADLPPPWRHQQVLDLQHPEAYAYVCDALLALLDEYDIAFLKWDHNRDLIDVAHAGRPAVHGQTVRLYALLDELRQARPGLEIESCASGGGRVDLGILRHAQRVWPSDSNDALERQMIQRWTGLLVPPEMVGSHVGPSTAHTTGRTHTLGFRAATAVFGHFGIEWDVATAGRAEREELAEWIALYKRERALLHNGTVVVGDHPDPTVSVHGVVAADRSAGLFAVTALATSTRATPVPVRLPGLDGRRSYRLQPVGRAPAFASVTTGWVGEGPVVARGDLLTKVGISLPVLRPETTLVLRAAAMS